MIEIFGFFIIGTMVIFATFWLIVELGVKYKSFRDKRKYSEDSDLSGAIIGFIIVVVLPFIMFFVIFS